VNKTGASNDRLFFGTLVFFFMAPFVHVKGIYDFVILPQSAFIQIFSLVLAAGYLLTGPKRLNLKKCPLNGVVAVFLVWTLVACIYAINPYEALRQWGLWAGCGLIFFLSQQLFVSVSRIYAFLSVVFFAGFLTAVIGICQHLFHLDWIPQAAAPAATFANKNMAAQFITLTFPLGVCLFFGTGKKTDQWVAVICGAAMMLYLAYTRTRAAWLAVFVELCLMGAVLPFTLKRFGTEFGWMKKKVIWVPGLLLVLIPAFFLSDRLLKQGRLMMDRALPVTVTAVQQSSMAGTDSVSLRLAIWQNTLEMIKERPVFGYGLGNHKIHYPKFNEKAVKEIVFSEISQPSHVHNDFLQLLAETGVIGGGIGLIVFVLFFVQVIRLWQTASVRVVFAVLGLGTAMAGILINACFSFPFDMPIPPLMVAGYMAGVVGLTRWPDTRYPDVSGPWKTGAGMVFLLAAAILSVYYYRDIQSDRYYLNALSMEKNRNWPAVIQYAETAYTLNPHRTKALSYAARGYIETGAYQKGVDALEKVIQAYPYHMGALLNLGVAWTGRGEPDKAMAYYQRALAIKPDFSKAHINMGGIYMGRKKYADAVNAFEKALENEPENPMVLYNLGICHYYQNAYEAAARILEKAVILRPDMVNARLNLAILYYQHLKQPEKSVPHFKQVLALQPDVANKEEIQRIIHWFDTTEKGD
jgi:O-antigen ligase/Tfp pilus assembly protein PilF